ncbi:SDR family oxidoreductase [Verrucomicrobia bacterium]|nr:SDR family oxidoreductase [Verrucomicrobiota bacterium]
MKKILIVGGTGATGKLLMEQFLDRGMGVRVIVRSVDRIPEAIRNHENLDVVRANLLELSDEEMAEYVSDCGAVASCLGHTLSWKGIYGQPRRLVADAVRRLCSAINTNDPEEPTKFVLMNTTGNSNRDLNEKISFAQKSVMVLLRLLLPPHVDNEEAADFLRLKIGKTAKGIQWVAVRPDGLTDEDSVSGYELHASPTRSAIFDAGKTSRINVAHFMADLVTDEEAWGEWSGKMPVIYNLREAQEQ